MNGRLLGVWGQARPGGAAPLDPPPRASPLDPIRGFRCGRGVARRAGLPAGRVPAERVRALPAPAPQAGPPAVPPHAQPEPTKGSKGYVPWQGVQGGRAPLALLGPAPQAATRP